jgi:hypothetical protein
MTKYLGLFLFTLTFNAFAGTNAILMLRAVVPEKTKVEVKMEKSGPKATYLTNHKGKFVSSPKFLIKKHSSHYLVSVTHP